MDLSQELRHARPATMSDGEWALRLELAACYRLFDVFGWVELIYNHITVRVPSEEGSAQYLINPYGLNYCEVTATNLVKVDVAGNKVDGSPHAVNAAGFVIHSAIHAARHDDAHCIMHTHTTAGMAVACKTGGLRSDNFYSAMLAGRVGYHDFEGITTGADEQPRLVASLGSNDVLILRNHGLLAVGPHIPAAFVTLWTLQRACEVQQAADAMCGDNIPVADHVLRAIPEQLKPLQVQGRRLGEAVFDATLRRHGIRYENLV